jgi:hypothetical protein
MNTIYVHNWTQDPQGIIIFFCSNLTKKLFLCIMTIPRMTFKFEYLGKFKFIPENGLVYKSGDQ